MDCLNIPQSNCPGDIAPNPLYGRPVEWVRRLLARRGLATLICCAVLALRLLLPSGYMVEAGGSRITISICNGVASAPMSVSLPLKHDGGTQDSPQQGEHVMPCPYGSLAHAALPAVDPIQLAQLLVFILALGWLGHVLPTRSAPTYIRPPLRGPPIYL